MDESGRKIVKQLLESANKEFYKDVIYKIDEMNSQNDSIEDTISSYRETVKLMEEKQNNLVIQNTILSESKKELEKEVASLKEQLDLAEEHQRESMALREERITSMSKRFERDNGLIKRKEKEIVGLRGKIEILEAEAVVLKKREKELEHVSSVLKSRLNEARKAVSLDEKVNLYEGIVKSLASKLEKATKTVSGHEEKVGSLNEKMVILKERLNRFEDAELDRVAAETGRSKDELRRKFKEGFNLIDLREFEAMCKKKKISERAKSSKRVVESVEFVNRLKADGIEEQEGSKKQVNLKGLIRAARR